MDAPEVFGFLDFAGGVALQTKYGVLRAHARAIVSDADELFAALFEFDGDATGTGIERVFDELFDGVGGPLHNFARRDFIGYVGRQLPNALGHNFLLGLV
jgi:hypothetical protein